MEYTNVTPRYSLAGLQIIPDRLMEDRVWTQVRFPRSKKKRIRRKWAKQRKNFREVVTPWDKAFQIGNHLMRHPTMLERLEKAMGEMPAPPPKPFGLGAIYPDWPPQVSTGDTPSLDRMRLIMHEFAGPVIPRTPFFLPTLSF